jgi:hypothetical protein
MNVKILVTIEGSTIRACANGSCEIYVEDMNTIGGIEQIQASEIPDADFNALIEGRDIQGANQGAISEAIIKARIANKMKMRVARLNNFRPVCDEKKFQPALAEYEKVRQPALAEYEKVRQTAAKPLLKLYKQDVPMGTWNGKNIFKK